MSRPAPLAGAGRLAGAAALIAVLTVASRLAGFGRTAVFTWSLAPTDLGGTYVVANAVPNFIFEIVAGGALASLVVPLLAGAVAAGDRTAVARTTGALLTWTLALLVPLAVLVVLFAGPIVESLGHHLTAAQQHSGVRMLRVFAPQLPLYGVGIVLTGVLQAHRRFAWPVLAPLLSSLTVIVVYLGFTATQGRYATVGGVSPGGEVLLSAGTTLGVVVLSLSLLIPVRRLRLGLRAGFGFPADARARVGGLAVAGAVTVTTQQIALIVSLNQVTAGARSNPGVYNLAQTVYLLPWAVLAVPLAIAAYPTLAAARAAGDEDTYRATLAPAVRGVLLFSCLGTAALIGTAGPVGHFFFSEPAASSAAAAIIGYAPGLVGYGLFAVLTRALYARGETRAATLATAVGFLVVPAVVLLLGALLPLRDRVLAVTSANSVGMLLLGALLLMAVARSAGRLALAGAARAGAAGGLAGVLAALAGLGLTRWLDTPGGGTPTMAVALGQGMLSGVLVGAVFLAVVWFVDRRDVQPLLAGVLRRLRRRGPRGGAPTPPASSPERGDGKETATR
ncbi:murein biosynthesis integral membrane protein MurJ [Micromonospora parathelypteridis]|uniref:Putative peptidoglycan lipid II flippase n=1 Tax=Micromonospora parathelypteridis TaxID=1839617 RepID=A0A840W905_9ACTN|nr:lipid II flippase MurJ [Micromonospora parathelypteridis]MBB5480609.1 putative peptidoglycan lipid II flippase [Micromonospora parathelypteridis]GGO22528.1 membrane protein [Micromonospora parathelypteridis]